MTEIRVQIYFARYGYTLSERLFKEYLALIPAGICSSILRYNRFEDRQATLFGKLLLLRALQNNFPDNWFDKFHSLKVSQYGKPFIEGGPEFNISHSEHIVILALAGNQPIGIDIEKIRLIDINDFSKELPEVATLYEHYEADQANLLFFDCWTQKEAVLKANGKGLAAPLKQVILNAESAFFDNTRWIIKKLLIDENYCCHVAAHKHLEEYSVECVDLMNGF